MEIIACKGRPFSAFVDEFVSHFVLLQLYSNHIVLSFWKCLVELNEGSHFESLDALRPCRKTDNKTRIILKSMFDPFSKK